MGAPVRQTMEDALAKKEVEVHARQARRTELIDIAIKVVAERGLSEASFRTIAAEAGTSTTAFTYEFGNRDALLTAIVERSFEVGWERKGFDRDDDAEDPLGKLRRATWAGIQADREIDPWVRTYDRFVFEFDFQPGVSDRLKELDLRMLERHERLIDLAREQGQIDPGIPSQDVLFMLWSFGDGLNIHRYAYPDELDAARIEQLYQEGFDRILGVRVTD